METREQQYEDLVVQLRRVSRGDREFHFWFCPKAADDLPVLLVERAEGPLLQRAKAARQGAKLRTAASGTVVAGADGELVFRNVGKLEGDHVERLFRTALATEDALGPVATLLRKARVLSDADYAAWAAQGARASEPGRDGDDLHARAARMVDSARDVLGDDPVVTELEAHLRAAGADAEALAALLAHGAERVRAALLARWDRERAEGEPQLEAALPHWRTSDAFARAVALRERAIAQREADNLVSALDLYQQFVVALDALREAETDDDPADLAAFEAQLAAAALAQERAAVEQALADAEVRWARAGEPDAVLDAFDRAARACAADPPDLAAAARILAEEIEPLLVAAERAAGAAREIRQATGGGSVALGVLAGELRRAAVAARAQLERLRERLLAEPEVVHDPRFPQLAERLASLADLVPTFGDDLDLALDRYFRADEDGRPGARAEVLAVVARHRALLDADPRLGWIDESPYPDVRVHAALADALDRVAAQVGAAP